MDSAIAKIKQKLDIVEFIGSYITLKKSGRNYKANCPFHDEKTPSFMVSPDRQMWRCFGACQDGGDVIAFLMKWDNLTFVEAMKELAQQTGIKLDLNKVEDKEWKKREHIQKLNEQAAKFYHYLLTEHASGLKGREYLKKRDISNKLTETFQLGYAPKTWDSLLKFLKKKGYTYEEIEEAGLAIQSKKGGFYDRFRGRLMFPIIDKRDVVIGFSGRLLQDDAKQAKYVNTPETLLYHKRESVYGIHVAKDAIRKEETAILVEGEFDMISSYKHGVGNTVAVKGSAVTTGQLKLLKRMTQHIILALDADFSGTHTTMRAIQDAEKMGFRIDVIQFDFGKDPDEALNKDPIAYKKLLKKPKHVYDFIIDTAIQEHDIKDPYGKDSFTQDIAPFIGTISNPIIRNHYVKRVAGLLDTDQRSVELMLKKADTQKRQRQAQVPKREETQQTRTEALQQYILARMLQAENPLEYATRLSKTLEKDDFSVPSYAEIFSHFDTYIQQTKPEDQGSFNMSTFTTNFEAPLQAVLDDLFLYDLSADEEQDNEKTFKRTLLELKQLQLKDTIKKALKSDAPEGTIQKMTQKLTQVEKELSIL